MIDDNAAQECEDLLPFYVNGRIESKNLEKMEECLRACDEMPNHLRSEIALQAHFVRNMQALLGPENNIETKPARTEKSSLINRRDIGTLR